MGHRLYTKSDNRIYLKSDEGTCEITSIYFQCSFSIILFDAFETAYILALQKKDKYSSQSSSFIPTMSSLGLRKRFLRCAENFLA
jgi:hypothetical protein